MDVRKYLNEETLGFICQTCNGTGGLKIGDVTYLALTCPTCHGESRGMPIEEYFEQIRRDAEFDEKHNAALLAELRRRKHMRKS